MVLTLQWKTKTELQATVFGCPLQNLSPLAKTRRLKEKGEEIWGKQKLKVSTSNCAAIQQGSFKLSQKSMGHSVNKGMLHQGDTTASEYVRTEY